MTNRQRLKKALKMTFPVFTGYLCLGAGFGILLESKGYGVLWALVMSITMYAGSMQYVAVDLIATGASLISVAITTLLVQARHLFYGISILDKYKGAGAKKAYMIHALTDETYSLICSDDSYDRTLYFYVSVLDHLYWITGCVLGDLIGTLFDFNTEGVDFVLTALFVTIFIEQWLTAKNHLSAIIGIASTTVCLFIFGREMFLIPSMVLITVLLTVLKKFTGHKEGRNDV
ncbi:MAG: AzlC family ABC transporter permease [Clostridia bacterium]|nr:AzlC family ABC transporter permease [Clostridia bacterium]